MRIIIPWPPGGAVVKMSPAEFGKLMVAEQNKWLDLIKRAGIKGEQYFLADSRRPLLE